MQHGNLLLEGRVVTLNGVPITINGPDVPDSGSPQPGVWTLGDTAVSTPTWSAPADDS